MTVKIVFTKLIAPHTAKKEKIIRRATCKEISLRRAFGYRILIIRRKRRNIVHDTILLHTTTVAEEVHLVYLPLIFHLQLLLLNGKSDLHLLPLSNQARLQLLRLLLLSHETGPEFVHLLLELRILLLCPLDLSLQGFLFPFQLVCFSPDSPLLPLSQL